MIVLLILLAWCVPGLFVGRGVYRNEIRSVNQLNSVRGVLPPEPSRPLMGVSELLHENSDRFLGERITCSLLKGNSRVCNCASRDEWLKVREQWRVWNEWKSLQDRQMETTCEPSLLGTVLSVPFWPVALSAWFIKGGAKTLPNYREIERLEQNELSNL